MTDIYYFAVFEQDENDLSGSDYRDLLQFAFTYGRTLSFSFHSPEDAEVYFGGFLSYAQKSLLPPDYDRRKWLGQIWLQQQRFYPIDLKLQQKLLEANSLFDWCLSNTKPHPEPEDLCFFRGDGSMLFTSCTHEGECALYLREDEARPAFLSRPGWELLTLEHPYYEGYRLYEEEFPAPSAP